MLRRVAASARESRIVAFERGAQQAPWGDCGLRIGIGTRAGLSLYLQGQNLTDERFASIDGDGNRLKVLDYQIYGRRFLIGASYKF